MEIECPDCDGEGHIETMTGLSYGGNQRWKIVRCETCDGSGRIEIGSLPEIADDIVTA
jgi:DnaJ-class molecular chaperone